MGFEAITGPNWIVPTPAAGDSSHRVADTEFVAGAVAAGTTGFTLQTQFAQTTSFILATSTMAGAADTIPLATDGTQIVTVTLTPNSSSNNVLVEGLAAVASTSGSNQWMALFQDSNNTAVAAIWFSGATGAPADVKVVYFGAVGTTSATTFKIRVGNFNGANSTFAINGQAVVNSRRLGGAMAASLVVHEIKV